MLEVIFHVIAYRGFIQIAAQIKHIVVFNLLSPLKNQDLILSIRPAFACRALDVPSITAGEFCRRKRLALLRGTKYNNDGEALMKLSRAGG